MATELEKALVFEEGMKIIDDFRVMLETWNLQKGVNVMKLKLAFVFAVALLSFAALTNGEAKNDNPVSIDTTIPEIPASPATVKPDKPIEEATPIGLATLVAEQAVGNHERFPHVLPRLRGHGDGFQGPARKLLQRLRDRRGGCSAPEAVPMGTAPKAK